MTGVYALLAIISWFFMTLASTDHHVVVALTLWVSGAIFLAVCLWRKDGGKDG